VAGLEIRCATKNPRREARKCCGPRSRTWDNTMPFNPHVFAVRYEAAAGTNIALSRAIDECLRSEPRLGSETSARLCREHVEQADQSALQRARGEFEKVAANMAEAATRTGDRAGEFGEQLGDLTQALKDGDTLQLGPVINRALDRTAGMKESAFALQREVMASGQEIERLRVDLSRAREESEIDPLTRLLNRKGFDLRLDELLHQALAPGARCCIVMLDIDRFKTVNDTFGHVMGDRVLRAVAGAIRGGVSDPSHSVARYGGEEFALSLPQCKLVTALAVAEARRQRVKALRIRDRRSQTVLLNVTVSAGVAEMNPEDDALSLVARADAGRPEPLMQRGRMSLRCNADLDRADPKGSRGVESASPSQQ
jgi:diguanylate cyclase